MLGEEWGKRTIDVTKILKALLVFVVIAGVSHNAAQAGKKRFGLSVNHAFPVRIAPQRPADHYRLTHKKQMYRLAQSSNRRISPSAALRAAQRTSPGSRGLGVRYMNSRQGYVVKLRTRNSIRKVFVDGRTGRVRR